MNVPNQRPTNDLTAQLAELSPAIRARLTRGHFDPERLRQWAVELSSGSSSRDARNRLTAVDPPNPGDVSALPPPDSAGYRALVEAGELALRQGRVALVVLAGGMATRMGSVVKALVEALPGRTFLDLRIAQQQALIARYGTQIPLWLMTSEATEEPIRTALGPKLDGDQLATFPQFVSVRLTPDGQLFYDKQGEPSLYPTGHGDLPAALQASGRLTSFIEAGGAYVWIANLDNLGASIDPAILGWHIHHGEPLTVEVVEKAGDKGGIPVRHREKLVICEDIRLPTNFDTNQVNVFNTNTFLVNARSLAAHDNSWTYCEVEKKVGDKVAIQRERLLGELSMHLTTRCLHVPRVGAASRFLPIKDPDELLRRRPDIEAVTKHRGG